MLSLTPGSLPFEGDQAANPRVYSGEIPLVATTSAVFIKKDHMDKVPAAVIENIKNKETVLFIGSGFSYAAGLPSAGAIASHLGRKLNIYGQQPLDKVAERFATTYGRGRLVAEVESFLKAAPQDEVSPTHRLLASLVKHGFIKTIITTNYDTLIEDAFALLGVSINVIAHESQLYAAAGETAVLYKIHGDFAHPELLVLTPTDYQRWDKRPEILPIVNQLKALLDTKALLFLGYSLSDFNVLALLLGSESSTRGTPRHKRFASVHPGDDLENIESRLQEYQVQAFSCDNIESLLRLLLLQLPIKLKVKHLVFNYPSWYPDQQARYGGIETFIRYLTKYAGNFEHLEVSVYREGTLQYSPSHLAYTSGPIYPSSYFFFRAVAKAALEEMLYNRMMPYSGIPDVVHMHFLAFSPLCENAGIATLCTSHSLLSLDLAYSRGLFDGIASEGGTHELKAVYDAERTAAASVRFVTVLSRAHERELRSLGARGILCVDAPFDCHEYNVEEDQRAARERAGVDDRFTITYVGRPDRRKGLETLIRACECLAERDDKLQLLLVGHGFSYSNERIGFGSGRYWFDASGLEQRGVKIQRKDAYNSVAASVFYACSDIVAVPSLYEPMGYVVLEAMACGRPVVASRVGGIVDNIVDGHNGMLFEPGNVEQLAEKLISLHRDPAARRRLGQQARQDIEKRKPAKDIVSDWEILYRKAAFAFGESLYPDPDLMESIRHRCEKITIVEPAIGVYRAAKLGCQVAAETISQNQEKCSLPEGVPIDPALIRAVAFELQRALRRAGVESAFSVAALGEVMNDLSLAVLNQEPQGRPGFRVDPEETKNKICEDWFGKAVGNPPRIQQD